MNKVFRGLLLSVVLCVSLATLLACSSDDSENLVGTDNPFLTPNQFVNYDTDSLANPEISFENFSIDSGYTTEGYSFIGIETNEAKTITATTYLKFWAEDFPTLDTATALSAKLILTLEEWQDSTAGQSVEIEVHNVLDSWQTEDIRSKYPLTIDTDVLATFTFTIEDSGRQTVELPLSFAEALLEDIQNGEDYLLDSSKGIALVPKSASTLAAVDFSETQLRITLDRQTTSGSTERLSKLLDINVSAYTVETNYGTYSNDYIYVQSVSADAAHVTFNMDFLQPRFQIGKAVLSLVRDTLYSEVVDSLYSFGLGLAEADLSVNDDLSIKYFSVDSTGAIYTANVTEMVQTWALNQADNNGFIIRPIQELSAFNIWRFYGASEAVGLRPRLRITYTVSN